MLHSFIPTISVNSSSQYDSVRSVIRDFRESINQSNNDGQSMSEEEFRQLVDYIRRRVSIDSDPTGSHQEQNTSREILEEIRRHSRTQTEFLRQITEILSSVTETRTIVKLSLAFALFWTFNKFLNRQ